MKTVARILDGLDRLAGAVQDVPPNAFEDPLRADARKLLLSGLSDIRGDVVRMLDAMLDGRRPRAGAAREALAMLRALRPALAMIRCRPAPFVDPAAVDLAEAIERDVRYLSRLRHRLGDPAFQDEAGMWLYRAKQIAARLRAGRAVHETTAAVVELGRRAREILEDFGDDL